MIILGIETSCDETAAAVVNSDSTILAETIHSQIKMHEKYLPILDFQECFQVKVMEQEN